MIIAILSLLVSIDIVNNKNYKTSTKLFGFGFLAIGVMIFPICFVEIFLTFLPIIQIMFLVLWTTILCTISLIFAIKDFLNVWIINKKLKQN